MCVSGKLKDKIGLIVSACVYCGCMCACSYRDQKYMNFKILYPHSKEKHCTGLPQAMQSSRFLAVLTVAAVVNSLDVDVEQ